MIVNICGVPHKVIECDDNFNDVNTHFGLINHRTCEIRINKNMPQENKDETLCHEMVHGMLIHIGYDELSQNEKFVQALGNAIYQGFSIKAKKEEEKEETEVPRHWCADCGYCTLSANHYPCRNCFCTDDRPYFTPIDKSVRLSTERRKSESESNSNNT